MLFVSRGVPSEDAKSTLAWCCSASDLEDPNWGTAMRRPAASEAPHPAHPAFQLRPRVFPRSHTERSTSRPLPVDYRDEGARSTQTLKKKSCWSLP